MKAVGALFSPNLLLRGGLVNGSLENFVSQKDETRKDPKRPENILWAALF